MNNIWLITGLILLMLILERIIVGKTTQMQSWRPVYRENPLFHPNGISIMRLPMGIISAILAARGHWTIATLWFAFWMITDLSDGTIARNCDLGTEMGKWLDPLSDKFMYFPVLLLFCFSKDVTPQLNPVAVILFILIDIVGQASRLFVKKKAANQFGKAKTAIVTILLSLLALNQIDHLSIVNLPFVDGMMWMAVILAFLSCYCKIIPDNWYANTLTLANFVCGIIAIVYAFKEHYIHCMVFVFIGQFFDLFDGRMARKYGSTKRGALFDDIADATSFGLAIGIMIFLCLSKEVRLISTPMAAIISIFYLFCLIYRLYRFMKPTKPMPKGVFQGLPSPAGAMFAGASVLCYLEVQTQTTGIIAAMLVIIAAVLMVSNIPYCHFGQAILPALPKFIKMLFCILFSIFTICAIAQKVYRPYFIWCLFIMTVFYLIYGIHWINKLKLPANNK